MMMTSTKITAPVPPPPTPGDDQMKNGRSGGASGTESDIATMLQKSTLDDEINELGTTHRSTRQSAPAPSHATQQFI